MHSAVLLRVDFCGLILNGYTQLPAPVCAAVYKVLYTVYKMNDVAVSDVDILKDASADLSLRIKGLKIATNCKSHEKVTKEKLMRQTKETLVNCLFEGYQTVCSQSDKFESSRVFMEQIKSELIAAQRSVVKLQQQILEAQAKQLDTMSNVVDTAVDKGIRTHSQALFCFTQH